MPRNTFLIAFIFLAYSTTSHGFDFRSLIEKIPQVKQFSSQSEDTQARNPPALPNIGKDFEDCPNYFFNGKAPVVKNFSQITAIPISLCFDGFAILYSPKHKIPVYSAEMMSRESLNRENRQERTNVFFEDARLKRSDRATLEDYKGSGFDRGHNFPAGNSSTPESMAQSFSLANMMPQAPEHNRKLWEGYETATRKYVRRAQGNVYVVTGSIVDPYNCTINTDNLAKLPRRYNLKTCTIGNGVAVPTYIYKVVLDSSTSKAWGYWTINKDGQQAGPPISYSQIVQRTGIDFFPDANIY